MSEKFAHWATAVSMFISALALGIGIYKFTVEQNEKEILDWQKVAVYESILQKPGSSFDEIKINYVIEANQIHTFELPKTEIQDDALRKVLLELQGSGLINLRANKTYAPQMIFPQENPATYLSEMISILEYQKKNHELFPKVRIEILDLVKNECDKYTQEVLYRKISNVIDIEEEVFYSMLHEMRGREVLLSNDGTWCETYDSEIE